MAALDAPVQGGCNCGAVAFEFNLGGSEPFFRGYCHCRACSRAHAVSPVMLFAVPAATFAVTRGEEHISVRPGQGRMTHAFCTQCGCAVWQCPAGASFRALFPVTFHIERPDPAMPCGVSCKLPEEMLPVKHFNYENRLVDWHDPLPKFVRFGGQQMNNDGTLKEEEEPEGAAKAE